MSGLCDLFDTQRQNLSGKALDEARQHYFIQAQMNGSDDACIAGINVNTSGRRGQSYAGNSKNNKASFDVILDAILDDMTKQLAALEKIMNERFESLKATYGDDVIGGMAETFLSQEELKGLNTDEAKLRALADKMLDEIGNIKTEYQHLEEAKYVRDWQKAQQLRSFVEQYNDRDTLTVSEAQNAVQVINELELVDQENVYLQSLNDELKGITEKEMDERTAESAKTYNTFNFSS